LALTEDDKQKAMEVLARQDADLVARAKAEEELCRLYDDAVEALNQERTDTRSFNTAVLKTHWSICKLHDMIKRYQAAPSFLVGNGNGNSDAGERENDDTSMFAMKDGLDVLRLDEKLLDRVYHWVRKNMAAIVATAHGQAFCKDSKPSPSPDSSLNLGKTMPSSTTRLSRAEMDKKFKEAAQSRVVPDGVGSPPPITPPQGPRGGRGKGPTDVLGTLGTPVLDAAVMGGNPSRRRVLTADCEGVGVAARETGASQLGEEGMTGSQRWEGVSELKSSDADDALRRFISTAKGDLPTMSAHLMEDVPVGRLPVKSVEEWVGTALEHSKGVGVGIKGDKPLLLNDLGSPVVQKRLASPFEGNRHSPLPPIVK